MTDLAEGPRTAASVSPAVANPGATGARGTPSGVSRPDIQRSTVRRRKRQMPWVLAGLLLVSGSALGFAVWADMQSERTRVLVAARDIALGQTVEQWDFREASVAVDDAMAFVASRELGTVVGQTAQSAIPEGAVVAPAHLGDKVGVPAQMAVVGASLDAGAFPVSDLARGDLVDLFEVAASRQDESGEQRIGAGEVWAVEGIDLGGEPRIFLSLLVASDIAGAVTNAEARDLLHVVLSAGGQ